jgi:hypothetical protein
MSIIRSERPESNFYILDKAISENKSLSWAARGLLIFLLGKPNAWKVSVANLTNETGLSEKKTGRDGIYTILNELVNVGYITRARARNDGKLAEMDYTVYDTPRDNKTQQATTPKTDNPDVVNETPVTPLPYRANPTQVSIDKSLSIETPILTPEQENDVLQWAKGKHDDLLVAANIEYFKNYIIASKKKYVDYEAACRNSIIGNWAKYRGVVTANYKGALKNERTNTLDELTGRNRKPSNNEREVFAATH